MEMAQKRGFVDLPMHENGRSVHGNGPATWQEAAALRQMTFDLVREAMVEAMALWRRTPGGGCYPFAKDAPWNLMTREDRAGDYDARGTDGASSDVPLRPLPLTRAEVADRDRVSEWLQFIDREGDRVLVNCAHWYLAQGESRVPWKRIRLELGLPIGEGGLARRYSRALFAVCKRLNSRAGVV